MPLLLKKAKELEEKVDYFESVENMEERVRDLEKELSWAQVIEIEQVREL